MPRGATGHAVQRASRDRQRYYPHSFALLDSIHELQAEHVELLPERETLGVIYIAQVGGAETTQAAAAFAINKAVNVQSVDVAVARFNHVFS